MGYQDGYGLRTPSAVADAAGGYRASGATSAGVQPDAAPTTGASALREAAPGVVDYGNGRSGPAALKGLYRPARETAYADLFKSMGLAAPESEPGGGTHEYFDLDGDLVLAAKNPTTLFASEEGAGPLTQTFNDEPQWVDGQFNPAGWRLGKEGGGTLGSFFSGFMPVLSVIAPAIGGALFGPAAGAGGAGGAAGMEGALGSGISAGAGGAAAGFEGALGSGISAGAGGAAAGLEGALGSGLTVGSGLGAGVGAGLTGLTSAGLVGPTATVSPGQVAKMAAKQVLKQAGPGAKRAGRAASAGRAATTGGPTLARAAYGSNATAGPGGYRAAGAVSPLAKFTAE